MIAKFGDDRHFSEKINLRCGATKFQLPLKSMSSIERSTQPVSVLTCKVLNEFVLVKNSPRIHGEVNEPITEQSPSIHIFKGQFY